MGLDFIRSKGDRFVQKRDASKASELSIGDLLTDAKQDTRSRRFRCQLTDREAHLPPGVGAIARVLSETSIVIIQHAREIGHVLPEDTLTLIEAMRRNHRYGGVLSVIVTDEPDFNGEFTVRSKSHLK